jgi:pseudouridine kinase
MAVLDALTPARVAAEGPRLRRADTIVVDANLQEATLAALFALRPEAPVHADAVSGAKCKRLGPWLDRLHTLKLNRTEAELLCGLPSRTPRQRQRIADWFHQRGVRRLALSLGPQGLQLSTAEALCVLPAWKVPPLDVTGAGDALMAGLVHADLARWPLERAADFALGCAALTVSVAPSNHPDLGERAVRSLRRRLTEKSR